MRHGRICWKGAALTDEVTAWMKRFHLREIEQTVFCCMSWFVPVKNSPFSPHQPPAATASPPGGSLCPGIPFSILPYCRGPIADSPVRGCTKSSEGNCKILFWQVGTAGNFLRCLCFFDRILLWCQRFKIFSQTEGCSVLQFVIVSGQFVINCPAEEYCPKIRKKIRQTCCKNTGFSVK